MAINEFTDHAINILKKRYLAVDDSSNTIESIEELFRRVARSIASAETQYNKDTDLQAVEDEFYELMTSLRFLPNSPTLFNAGRPLGQLSACFVLPVEDSIIGIFEALKNAAIIHQSGGGTGFSFSRLRARGKAVSSTGGTASGPVSFMSVFNSETEVVKQGGKRRGANIGILRVDHPDIEEFISCKSDRKAITNFNISVGITESFMQAVEKNEDYELIDPQNETPIAKKSAREIFDKIVEASWTNGEPGIIFLDRLNENNVYDNIKIEATNPCGEQPLLPYESCNLGSINLMKCLKEEDGAYCLDESLLRHTVYQAVHFLDNVIDVNKFPLEIIEKTTKQTRKIGLGIMGLADALIQMGMAYNSDEGIGWAENVMKFINTFAHEASERLAETRGAFPAFAQSKYKEGTPIRNATLTTIAPTGTLSIIAGCSSGIEPMYACSYTRDIDGENRIFVNPLLIKELNKRNLFSDILSERILEEGTIKNIEEIPEKLRKIFVCSHDISPEYHVKMQAVLQKNVDNAVSKTINFHNKATKEDVAEAFKLSYQLNCKGITVYRDKSRESQVLNSGSNSNDFYMEFGTIRPKKRDATAPGYTERVRIGCGNLYITANYNEQGVFEIFTATGKDGGCPSQSQATARLISMALRSGISMDEVYDQLKGIRCPSTVSRSGMDCTSCPDAIAKVMRNINEFIKEQKFDTNYQIPKPIKKISGLTNKKEFNNLSNGDKCPDCENLVQHEGNCVICRHCGYSKCS